jgi:hypothetical protein
LRFATPLVVPGADALSHESSHNVVEVGSDAVVMRGMEDSTEIDIRAEIAKVQAELIFFRERCLLAFFGTSIHEVFQQEYTDWVQEKIETRAGAESNWRRATSRLAELLPLGPLPENAAKISRGDFRDFLFQEATPSFCVREGRIVWKISLLMDPTCCSPYCPTFPDLPAALENPARLSEIHSWLMRLPVDSTELANALCMVLPFIADADPSFAKLALDPATWRNVVHNDGDITEEQRAKRLKIVEGPWFAHVLNNAILHVLGSLANNHFLLIEDLLDHPHLVGGYTHLMPHYLFAVLFEKVAIVREFAQEGW